jgi:hypothetical protein
MLFRILVSCFAFSALASCALASQDGDEARLETSMGFFVGHCWNGVFSDEQSTDVQCFRSVYGGHFVRSNHQVEGALGPYGGETIFSWDAANSQINYTYWDTNGGISHGTMMPTISGLSAPDEFYDGADGHQMTIASRWEILSEDTWRQVVEEVDDTNRRTLWEITYTRSPLTESPN